MRLAIGVDPGLHGALALVTETHDILYLADTPTVKVNGRGKLHLASHYQQWVEVKELIAGRPTLACVERMNPGIGKGSFAVAGLFYHQGAIEAILLALGIPSFSAEPARWKRAMILSGTRDQAQSRLVASHLYPAADLGTRADGGRADALLLADYALRSGR